MKLTGTPRRFVFLPGRPAPALEGQWLGLDARGGLYVLRWEEKAGCWLAIGFETDSDRQEKNWPHLVHLKGDMAKHIVSHAAGPAFTQGIALASEGKEHG